MAKKFVSYLERFCQKFVVNRETRCWEWTGKLDRDGYAAQMRIGSRTTDECAHVKPHRWIYEQCVGPLNDGLVIDHLCRNRKCVNPMHLEAVLPIVNHHRGLRAMQGVCKNGHAIEGENEILHKGGHWCRICYNEYQRTYQNACGHKYSKSYRQRRKETKMG